MLQPKGSWPHEIIRVPRPSQDLFSAVVDEADDHPEEFIHEIDVIAKDDVRFLLNALALALRIYPNDTTSQASFIRGMKANRMVSERQADGFEFAVWKDLEAPSTIPDAEKLTTSDESVGSASALPPLVE